VCRENRRDATKHDCRVQGRARKERPADVILRFAKEEDVDVIVLGTHGRSGLVHLLVGSVAESVIRRAECPVMTIRKPSETGEFDKV
jgi:nucleotide-binding universal stress UspA family protein